MLASCTSTKNTGMTRWYHSFNTRYNVYFNGDQAYKEAMKAQQDGYTENYTEMILMYPVSALPKDKDTPGGPFDRAIEKAVKAIKTHSIQTKPERKSGKRNDPKYQEFMGRTEYNPFLHNAWMMMAKSQFHNGDFLQATTSFSYISRLYSTQPEIASLAKIWQARSYSELGWFYEAEDILTKLNNGQLPKKHSEWFSTVYADFLIKQKRYQEAIPYMQTAIKAEKNKFQKTREKYLLGQLYASAGQREMAYKTFGQVSSSSAPYILELSAKIRQTEVYPGGDIRKVTKQLNKMTKGIKNKEYLDQIYYALGNVYMTVPDTTKAIQSYELGVEKSTQNGLDKALNQIKLGDIYFKQRDYVKAQPNYSEALGQLKKGDEAFPRVSKRSEVLDALLVHYEAVHLQDSLQRLSRMSDEERMVVINKIIEDLIKKEKEEAEKAARDEYLAQQDDLRAEQRAQRPGATPPTVGALPPGEASSFYFYSPQAVTRGKNDFQQKWGRRKLEDDWRRRNKSNPMSDSFEDMAAQEEVPELGTDSLPAIEEGLAESIPIEEIPLSTDPKDPQFYLQQIPVTPEDIEASNLIIIDGLYNMGVIYREMLEDNALALETLESLNSRFPDNENKLMAYYHIYLIYLKEGNMEMANLYKARIRSEFPKSDYAIAMADPDYEYNMKMTDVIQDSLYRNTYESYLEANVPKIRKNYELVKTKYNQSKLMPNFMFLNALSFVFTNEADTFKVLLKELIDKYPTADVSVLAGDVMKGFQRGLLLANSGDNMLARGSLFNMRFGGAEADSLGIDSTLAFSPERNTPHELLLVYPKTAVNDNLLLYTVASFNFGNFMVNDFDLSKSEAGEIGMLHIKGFNNLDEVVQYLQMINQPGAYGQELAQAVLTVPISDENYSTLMKGKSLDEYMTFFEENFAEGNENLIARWRLKQVEEQEVLPDSLMDEIFEEEIEVDPLPDIKERVEEEIREIESENPIVPVEMDQDTTYVDIPRSIEHDTIPVELTTDSIRVDTIRPDTVHSDTIQLDKDVVPDSVETDEEDVLDTVNDVYNKASDGVEDATNKVNEIMDDPVRGIQNLFKRKKSNAIDDYVKEQEKEEKERQKQLKKEKEAEEKAAKELAKQEEKERKELLKQQEEENRALLKAKEQQEKDLKKMKENERKQKEDEKKRLAKEKEQERKDAQKEREAERKAKEKAREEERKIKEAERKEAQKVKEAERKEKEKVREEERKRKEEERKAKQKAREEERKQKEAERKANRK